MFAEGGGTNQPFLQTDEGRASIIAPMYGMVGIKNKNNRYK